MQTNATTESDRPIRYDIIDRRTGAIVGRCKSLGRALQSVDRRDSAWGGYRYAHRPVYVINATREA